jgi:hypothetical protein
MPTTCPFEMMRSFLGKYETAISEGNANFVSRNTAQLKDVIFGLKKKIILLIQAQSYAESARQRHEERALDRHVVKMQAWIQALARRNDSLMDALDRATTMRDRNGVLSS